MNPELETLRYPDITSVRTNHKLIFDPFKELVKKQGMDVCYVTNNFWRAYVEAAQIGKVDFPTNQPQTQEGQNIHYHTHLHLHTSYVVDRPRRRTNLEDIPYICQAKGCKKTAENKVTYAHNKQPYNLCAYHTDQALNTHPKPTVQPLIKVYKSNTINEQKINRFRSLINKLRGLFK